jgi:hypothetical protein
MLPSAQANVGARVFISISNDSAQSHLHHHFIVGENL